MNEILINRHMPNNKSKENINFKYLRNKNNIECFYKISNHEWFWWYTLYSKPIQTFRNYPYYDMIYYYYFNSDVVRENLFVDYMYDGELSRL